MAAAIALAVSAARAQPQPDRPARIAGRPGIAQVRQILRGSKDAIEQRLAQQDKH